MKIIPQVDKEGGVGMENAAGFFANVFGGERFRDWVCVLAILFTAADLTMPTDRRDLSHEGDDAVATTMMSNEEQADDTGAAGQTLAD
jgi:hypothetical protein